MTNQSDLHFKQSENVFRTLIEESLTPVGLYVGSDMIIKVANKAIISVWGKGSEVIDKPYFDVLPELRSQSIYPILNKVYTTGIPYEATEGKVDLVMNGKPESFYFNFSFKPLKDEDGNVWGVLNTAANVTDLVLMRQKLAESEQRTQFALDAAELGTWDLNPLSETVIWDKRCRQLFGTQKGDLVNYTDVLSCIHPDDISKVETQVAEAIDPALRRPYEIQFRTVDSGDNTLRWLKAIGNARFNNDNVCVRFAGTVQDITREIADTEEQQKLLALIDNTAEVIGVTTLDAQVTYLNKAGYKMLGIDHYGDAFVPASAYFMHDSDVEIAVAAKESILQTGRWEGERVYRHFKTGEPIPIYLNAFRVDDPATGKPIAMASVARDLRPERAARMEQDKLLSLIEHSSDCIMLSNTDHYINYVNTAGRELLGLGKSDYKLRQNTEFIMPDQLDKLSGKIAKAVDNKGRWSGEINYRNFKTGEAIPVHATTMVIRDPLTGKSMGRAGIARDMRREIADKKALVDSEQLLQNITTAAPISLWMSDEEGLITYTNQTWNQWTGMPIDETLGKGWLNAIVWEDRQRAADKFISDLAARRPYEVDFRILNKYGDVRWCVATGNPQYRTDGSFSGYIGACTDVTEKKLAEQQLYLKNEELNDQIKQFEFVTGFMPVQLWTASVEGNLDYFNQRTLDFFGLTSDELMGAQWILQVHPEDRDGCIASWAHSLQTGDVYQYEFRLRDKDGNYKWHLARAFPFITDNKIVKWFGTNTDIDDQKVLQQQKDDFLGIASHELKTPVTSIKAYAQVLGAMLTKEGEQKKAAMVLRMDAQVNRLTNLIGDLLDVTKINSGRLQFNKTWFDLNRAIAETVEDLQHTTQRHKLIMEFTEIGKVYSDKDRIGQVITNLITNAIKYSPNADQIIIKTKIEDGQAIVSVKDFGIGIPEDKTERVFEQFYRVSGNKQHTFPGLGLGLYISSEIIKREGGSMWVHSTEGKGSDFSFAIPVNNQLKDKL